MKKTSFFLGVFICFITLGCSKQGAMDLQSLEDAYFEVAQNTVDEPLSVVELTEMLSNYAPKEMVDGNQKIYTFATDNEELMVSEPKDQEGITDILYTKHHDSNSLSVACHISSNGADTSASSLVLNTVDMDLFKVFAAKLNQEPSNLFDDYLSMSEKMLGDKPVTLTEIQKSINLEPNLQERGTDVKYYSFEDTDLGDVLGFYVTSTSETINQLLYKSNATGVLYNTTMANNAVMFSLSTEEATLSNQKEVMSLFDK